MKLSLWRSPSQRIGWLLILLALGLLLLMFSATYQSANERSGSTYNRFPDGYGAWYQQIQNQGIDLKRLQKPFDSLTQQTSPQTLLRINPWVKNRYFSLGQAEIEWVKKGNFLILLGVQETLTPANFSSEIPRGNTRIKIEGRRRNTNTQHAILGDRFGAVIWREKQGNGEIIAVTTPYLAANAYQDYPQNYQLLTELVTQYQTPLWVDEYLHGYKDAETIQREIAQDFWHYLLKTPLLLVAIQGIVILLILLWAANQRFGQAIAPITTKQNNSSVYIEALASVLERAKSQEFVVKQLQPFYQKKLQSQLGLSTGQTSRQTLLDSWEQQTQNPSPELESLLSTASSPRTSSDLQKWLSQWLKLLD
ncbi:MAG: DUF4350 domain-containing protein [Merismopediaceae bacterium]|nr:DUF4350 domain-containing protein [Merismopediaceae bacterium]